MFNPQDHLISLKGKDYLQVMWRLVWFRESCPGWSISTQLVQHDAGTQTAIFRATISDETGAARSTGYGSECAKDFHDYLEKAETKAVGRALAMMGYGTQFAPELDEEERLVDSPVDRRGGQKKNAPPKQAAQPEAPKPMPQAEAPTAPDAPDIPILSASTIFCSDCKQDIKYATDKNGQRVLPSEIAEKSKQLYGRVLCARCMRRIEAQKTAQVSG